MPETVQAQDRLIPRTETVSMNRPTGILLTVLPLLIVLVAAGCSSGSTAGSGETHSTAGGYPYDLHDALFQDRVSEDGLVNYGALESDPRFDALLNVVRTTNPDGLPEKDRLAFWINTYNLLVLEGVVRHYPVESVTKIRILHGFFKRETFLAAGRELTLDDIEHRTLREKFHEPRIHFALVCGAVSCPPLRQEAFRAGRIDEQLEDQARKFFGNSALNRADRDAGTLYLSSILDWFGGDFTTDRKALPGLLAGYFPDEDAAWIRSHPEVAVKFLDYDWKLNDSDGGK